QSPRDGPALITKTTIVVAIRLNVSMPDQPFDIQFPAGTSVSDGRDPAAYGKRFRAQKDASLVEIVPPEDSWFWRNCHVIARAALVIGLILTVLAVAYFVRRKRRTWQMNRTKADSEPPA